MSSGSRKSAGPRFRSGLAGDSARSAGLPRILNRTHELSAINRGEPLARRSRTTLYWCTTASRWYNYPF